MPRNVRIEYPGAVYHVLCRGDHRQLIFDHDEHRRTFLETLGEVCERTGFVVHSYVLMSNHYHLLLETPAGNLVAGMKWFQGTYTQRYNASKRQCGHLFQGRYKAVPVEREDASYFRIVSEYIHLNPARAGMLKAGASLRSYPWSSFPSFVTPGKGAFPWLVRSRVFATHDLADEGRMSCRRYAKYMDLKVRALGAGKNSAALDAEWAALRRGWYLGSDRFRDRLMDQIDEGMAGRKRASYTAEGMRGYDEKEADRLLLNATQRLGLRVEDLWSRRQSDSAKQAVAWWIKSRTSVGDDWICKRLEMGSRMNVHRAVSRYRRAADAESRRIKKLLLCAD